MFNSECILFNTKWYFFSAISWGERYIRWDDDDVHFVLDQHTSQVRLLVVDV